MTNEKTGSYIEFLHLLELIFVTERCVLSPMPHIYPFHSLLGVFEGIERHIDPCITIGVDADLPPFFMSFEDSVIECLLRIIGEAFAPFSC